MVPGGTPSSSACTTCTRYARVLIQEKTISSARDRSTSNMLTEKGFNASNLLMLKAGVPKRWLPNATHPATRQRDILAVLCSSFA